MTTFRPTQAPGRTGPLAPGVPGGPGGGSSSPHGPRGPRSFLRSAAEGLRRRWGWVLVAMVVAGGSLTAVDVASAQPTYGLTAVFGKAPGLFPGAAVEVLGVPVGTVSSVHNVGDAVRVGLRVDRGRPIPARAVAALVEPELLGEPNIELDPGYTGGPSLAPGAVIPEARTSVPVSTEQLLKSLQRTLDQLDPHAVGGLIANLAQDLNGQGPGLNKLISGAAGTLTLLANKADDLGQLSGVLAQLTGTLDSRTAEISQLVTDYDTVSSVLAQHGTQLGGSITQLSQASTQIVQLLTPNLGSLEQDVGTITTAGRTLDRNLGNVDQVFSSATSLFAAAQRAYTPTHNWLTLNLQTPVGVTGAYVAGLVRDRLAGVCRRIAANHSAGLTATQLATLHQCGNPASGFFNPIIDQVPAILNALASGTAPPSAPSPAAMLQQGLAQIPGLPSATSTAPSTAGGAGTGPGGGAGSGAGSGASPSTTTTTAPPSGSGSGSTPCLGDLLGTAVRCSSGSSGSGSGSSGSSGLEGLLAYRQPVSAAPPAPPLETAGRGVLPPLPRTAPGATPLRHRRPARQGRHGHGGRAGGRARAPRAVARGGATTRPRGDAGGRP